MANKEKIDKIKFVLYMVAFLWVVFVVDLLLPLHLKSLGLIPRTTRGLIGIITSPFLHANLYHLISNTVPLLILGLLLAIFYEKIAPAVIGIIVIVGGGLVWLLGRSANHIGASGVIYGIAAFLVVYGILKKNITSVLVAIIVAFLYGTTMLSGLLPVRSYISWESHLFCAAAGVIAAFNFRKRPSS